MQTFEDFEERVSKISMPRTDWSGEVGGWVVVMVVVVVVVEVGGSGREDYISLESYK